MVRELRTDDVVDLACDLIDIPSVSGDEKAIADAIEARLRRASHLEVLRDGDAIVARTRLARAHRVLIAGHLDTVPIVGNVPAVRCLVDGIDTVRGRGAVDMLGGVAVALRAALLLDAPKHDVTWVFYDHEEVEASLNGLGRLMRNHPGLLDADFAILAEPTSAHIEGGCNGSVRVIATIPGKAAHSARSWRGDNAIHKAAPVISKIASFGNPTVNVDGLDYRESLLVVAVSGGKAKNVVPDEVELVINYRFAPSKSADEAIALVASYFAGTGARIEVDDRSPGARPGADSPIARDFIAHAGAIAEAHGQELRVVAKQGWTDVARFFDLGIPAVNFGPGDPLLAHTDEEAAPAADMTRCLDALLAWLDDKEKE